MKPLLNLSEITDFKNNHDGAFKEQYCPVSEKIGAKKLGYNVVVLQPGFKACPFHNHHVNEEMFLILEGEGTLRFGDQRYSIKTHDVIACPPGAQDLAHQIINTSQNELRYLCLSTMEPVDICEYPDSNKVLTMAGDQGDRSFRHMSRLSENVDYLEGES